ncbi:MAG: hypothetical protein Q7T82_11845 [Armatimonadota bacterium]|nr:hypothetical protein [Armatimonadota bacterium]
MRYLVPVCLALLLSSAIVTCAVPPNPPEVITPRGDAIVSLTSPVMRWVGDPHDAYEVHINTTNSPTGASAWDSGTVSSADDSCDVGALANGSYYVFVRLRNADGWGSWSASGRRFTINVVGPAIKKGWVMIRDDVPYHLELLTHAREYHVNHVQLSHDIMMYAWEPINDLTIRNKVNQLIDAAHANGVSEVVLWVHDIQYTNMPAQYLVGGKVNLDDPGFWPWMDGQYEQLFQVCPNADGLVFTFSENFNGADFYDRLATTHTGKTPEDTLTQAIETLWNVCERHNKTLYIRNWTDAAGEDRWVRNAVARNDPGVWMMSKATGAGDWNVIQEDYDIIGTCTGHPELVEFDFVGEYWGYTYTPWAGIDYLRHLWTDFSVPRGADGVVARIDREDQGGAPGINPRVIECANRINMCALDILADYPDCSSDDIYRYWSNHWFGGVAGPRVASALKRTFDITNSCYQLPTRYPFSTIAAKDLTLRSLFDLDCAKAILQAASNFQAGYTNYDILHTRLMNAAGKLGLTVPSTLYGDFSPAYSSQTSPTCSAMIVDATAGLNPALFQVEYSTNGGATWTNHTDLTVTADGAATDAYHVTANSVPFGSLQAARNKIRFSATNLLSSATSKTYTVRGLDNAYITMDASLTSDGITHPQGGDGDTTATSAGGRSCRTTASSGDVNFYFKTDDGYAYDRSPQTIYLQVDYYGSSGSITPYYDGTDGYEEPLLPVYLSGGSTWRTATWKLDKVNFGHRIGSQLADFRLYVGSASNVVYISAVRLSYGPPAGMLAQPQNLAVSIASTTQSYVRWDTVPGATRYQVCRGTTAVGWPTGTSLADSGLSPNTQYSYAVTAYDDAGNTSAACRAGYAATLSAPPSTSTLTLLPQPGVWQTLNYIRLLPVGGFGAGKVAYYQYAFDESPTHKWTGTEAGWPGITPPTSAGWTVWSATSSPTDEDTGWLLYDGSTTQRLMSEELVNENGIPSWVLMDQGRVWNTKAKLGLWPNLTINRDTGATLMVRMRAVPSPYGWYSSSTNFGYSLADCSETGVIVRPDYLRIVGPSMSGAEQSIDNGYTYHTYTLTLRNATPGSNASAKYELYRDGVVVTNITQGPAGAATPWVGPFFGHTASNAIGAWAFQWMAWNTNGAYAPTPGPNVLMNTCPHYGSGYYVHARGFNSDGVPNGTADFGPFYYWNGSTPVTPTVVDDGAYTTSDSIHAKWSPVAPTASLYEYAIGTAAGLQDIVPFTGVGLSLEVTRTGLSLTEGSAYYVTVRGTVGSNTYTGSSDGITVAPARDKIAEAKTLTDNAPVALYGKKVTAALPDCAYVQDQNGMGIRVVAARPMTLDDRVDLAGKLAGAADERRIEADTVVLKGTGGAAPVGLAGAAIGGDGFLFDPIDMTGQKAAKAYQWTEVGEGEFERALVDMAGLNNIGLLVTAWGEVTWKDAGSFYMNDGSETAFAANPDKRSGVLVRVPSGVTPPAVGSYAVVTGISSLYNTGSGLCRVILVRRQSDIQVF